MVKKTRVVVHWANSPLSELGVCGRWKKKGDKAPTYSKPASLFSRAIGDPGESHPRKVPNTNVQLYGLCPWATYRTVLIQERLHGISRSISYGHYSHVSVTV